MLGNEGAEGRKHASKKQGKQQISCSIAGNRVWQDIRQAGKAADDKPYAKSGMKALSLAKTPPEGSSNSSCYADAGENGSAHEHDRPLAMAQLIDIQRHNRLDNQNNQPDEEHKKQNLADFLALKNRALGILVRTLIWIAGRLRQKQPGNNSKYQKQGTRHHV